MAEQTKVILQKNQITGRYDCFSECTNKGITYLTNGERFNLIDGKQIITGRIEHNGFDYYWLSDSGELKKELHNQIVGFISK